MQRDKGLKQLTVDMPEELHRRFKAKTALDGTAMQAQVIAWVEKYVKDFGGN